MIRLFSACILTFLFVSSAINAAEKIYPSDADPAATINQAITNAKTTNKAVLIVFGADWCGDCRSLHDLMAEAPVKETVALNFEVVHVDVGNWDKNEAVRKVFGYPAENGIPSLVIMDSAASIRFVSRNGEFAGASSMGKNEFNRRLEELLSQMKQAAKT